MVASDARLATEAGVEILRGGGNAADAAVATAFALAVVFPAAGNVGGGGFAVVRTATGEEAALDFREAAPGKATRDMYLDAKGEVSDESLDGALAAGVPGSVRGLWELHQKYGSRPWKEVLAPAIRLASEGFTVDATFAGGIERNADRFKKFPAAVALYLPGGKPPAVGGTWRNPDLAKVLQRVADQGPDGFYKGETARLVVEQMKRGNGIITAKDLEAYRAIWRTPITGTFRGHRVVAMPPPSSGGVAIVMLANILGEMPEQAWHSPEHLHDVIEAMRRVFADRNELLGDPDFADVDTAPLLSAGYAARQRKGIRPGAATPSFEVKAGAVLVEPVHTTHFSVVDGQGMAVALTTTVNDLFGCAELVAGAGFVLNNEMDDFTAKVGAENLFKLRQGERNTIAPGKRPLSSMSPTIVVGPDGKVVLVTGSRGGPRIITATFQVVVNVVQYGMSVGAAVAAPRVHHQHLPDKVWAEDGGLSDETRATLAKMGYTLEKQPRIQTVPSIQRTATGWTGTSDPRFTGSAAGH